LAASTTSTGGTRRHIPSTASMPDVRPITAALTAALQEWLAALGETQRLPSQPMMDTPPLDDQLTDASNAALLVGEHRERVRYVPGEDWRVYDPASGRWAPGGFGLKSLAGPTAAHLQHQAAHERDTNRAELLRRRARMLQMASHVAHAWQMAQEDERIVVSADAFDAQPWLLNTLNGAIDLQTGQLVPHAPEHLHTKLAPVQYVGPGARAEVFERFVSEIFRGDQELVAYVQRLFGYCLTGSTREHAMFVFHGPGRNGKTTLAELFKRVLGSYASALNVSALLAGRQSSTTSELAALRGARYATTAEAADEARFAGELIKLWTGGDTVQVRALYSNPIEFRPAAKLLLVTNALPRLNDRDAALWARIHAVPFGVVFPPDRVDRDLPEKLFREAPGVLAWAVRGCLAWQREGGLRPPAVVTADTQQYREMMCPVRQFLASACEPDADNFIVGSEMLMRFKEWALPQGHRLPDPEIKQRLEAAGAAWRRTSSARGYVGYRWAGEAGEACSPEPGR
jgi:putative DNA primase/helicase